MGRGPRTQASTSALAPNRVARPGSALAGQVTAIADAICASDNYEQELLDLNEKAQTSKDSPTRTAARGGRLMIAVNDIFQAEALSKSSNPADNRIAQAMLDSALPHLGRIVALADKDSAILPPLRQAIADYEKGHGLEQISDLERRGLIDSGTAAELRGDIDSLQGEAYASGSARPQWLAVPFMQRAAQTLDGLAASRALIDDKDDIAEIVDRAIEDCEKVLKGSSAWLADPKKGGNLRLNAPSQLIKAEAVLAACEDPQTRMMNSQIGEAANLNRDLVGQVAEVPDKPIFAVPDSRWLDLSMNYQMVVTGPTENTIAMASSHAIWLSPEVGRDAVDCHERGELSSTLVHELVHTTQSAQPEAPLPDKGPHGPGQLYDRHRTLESKLTEGSTQGLTNHLVGASQDISRAQDEHYPVYTALVDEVAARVTKNDSERRRFYSDLSACPDNRRAFYLAERLDGEPASEARVREFTEEMLPACDRAEVEGLDYHGSRAFFSTLFS